MIENVIGIAEHFADLRVAHYFFNNLKPGSESTVGDVAIHYMAARTAVEYLDKNLDVKVVLEMKIGDLENFIQDCMKKNL